MKPVVVFVVGPTAVGKSNFALAMARRWGGSIVNCDSVQCYKYVNIGAAKPTTEELQLCPHRMLSWVEPLQELTVAEFRSRAMKEIGESLTRGPVFAVGGSGFYIRALEKGLFKVKEVPAEVKAELLQRLQHEGAEALHRELSRLDPLAGEQIKVQDSYRVIRALSLMNVEGRPWSAIQAEFQQQESDWKFPTLKIGLMLPREELVARIEMRTAAMIDSGLIEEVRSGLAHGWRDWAPFRSVGYKEVVAFLEQEAPQSLEQLKEAISISTRQLAKKQMTWFRGDATVNWFPSRPQWNEAAEFLENQIEG